jgi:NAD(P)-dependent dehydrogenase (short-subunit alcohol dehydrogenase family)
MGRFEGRITIVTGAGRGIGRGVVVKLAREGAHVVVASRSKDMIDKVVGEILHLEKSAIRTNRVAYRRNFTDGPAWLTTRRNIAVDFELAGA